VHPHRLSEVNHYLGCADLLLTRFGVKHLVVEAKRSGALKWNARSVNLALRQAHRYTDEQKVHSIAVGQVPGRGVSRLARDPFSCG
jgi:hypothetical protein